MFLFLMLRLACHVFSVCFQSIKKHAVHGVPLSQMMRSMRKGLGTPSGWPIARQSQTVKLALTTAQRFVGRLPGPVCRGALAEGKRSVVTPGGIR